MDSVSNSPSTGPKTSAGKRKSSRNALKYRLCSRDVVPDEDPLEFEKLRAALEEFSLPLVSSFVNFSTNLRTVWRMHRGPRLEAAALGHLK
jgi:hypothetical protein